MGREKLMKSVQYLLNVGLEALTHMPWFLRKSL